MSPIRCLIIDDERLARAELAALLEEIGGCELIGQAALASEAMVIIQQQQPDLIFLDINMPGTNGFEMLAQLDNPPHIVFATAYDQYAIQAFEVRALDYLLKPIRKERLEACITNAKARIKTTATYLERLFVQHENGGYFLQLSEVSLIRAYGHYLRLYHGQKSSMIHRSVKDMEGQLDPALFFRINRSEIIKLDQVKHIASISRGRYELTVGEEQLKVSEARAVEWRKRFKI